MPGPIYDQAFQSTQYCSRGEKERRRECECPKAAEKLGQALGKHSRNADQSDQDKLVPPLRLLLLITEHLRRIQRVPEDRVEGEKSERADCQGKSGSNSEALRVRWRERADEADDFPEALDFFSSHSSGDPSYRDTD